MFFKNYRKRRKTQKKDIQQNSNKKFPRISALSVVEQKDSSH